jgi:hypothetical protein
LLLAGASPVAGAIRRYQHKRTHLIQKTKTQGFLPSWLGERAAGDAKDF